MGEKQATKDHVQGRVLSEEEILKQELEKLHHRKIGYPGGGPYAGGSDGGSGGSRGLSGRLSAGQGVAYDLPNHMIRPTRNQQGAQAGVSPGVPDDDDDMLDQTTVTGDSSWGGMSNGGIRGGLEMYASEKLLELGKLSKATLALVLSGLPPLRPDRLTGSHRPSIVKSFSGVAKGIKPSHDATFISLAEWWKMIGTKANDMGWTPAMRVRFLATTGGLPSTKAYEVRAERVKA